MSKSAIEELTTPDAGNVNKRQEPRRSWKKKAQLRDANNVTYAVQTHDISISGISCLGDYAIKPNQICILEVPYQTATGKMLLRIQGKVIYSWLSGLNGFRTGMQFVDLSEKDKQQIQDILS